MFEQVCHMYQSHHFAIFCLAPLSAAIELCITSRCLVQESLSYCPLTACAFLFPLRLKIPTLIRADLFLAVSLRLLASLSCL
jgi:hypothetical protein